MRTPFLYGASALAALFMGGCLLGPLDRTDATDLVENEVVSARTVGALAAETFGQTDSLSGSLSGGARALELLHSAASLDAFGVLAKQGLGKRREEFPWQIDFSDTLAGNVRVTLTVSAWGTTSYDTMDVLWDDAAREQRLGELSIITLYGTKHHDNGRRESYRITDRDGDGILAAPSGSQLNGSARYENRITFVNGVVEELIIDVGAGPDNDFTLVDDNLLLQVSWVKRGAGGDTLGYARFTDAHGDGPVHDPLATTPSVVDVSFYERGNPWKPFVDAASLNLRVVLTPGEEDVITRFSGEERFVGGRVSTVSVTTMDGDATVEPGTVARAVFETASAPASDPVKASRLELVFDVGTGLHNPLDNLYHEVRFTQQRRVGWIRSRDYRFTSATPVAHGTLPQAGEVGLTVGYRDGSAAALEAVFDEQGFSGTYTGPDGAQLLVVWDSEGGVVSSQEQ